MTLPTDLINTEDTVVSIFSQAILYSLIMLIFRLTVRNFLFEPQAKEVIVTRPSGSHNVPF